MTTCGITWPAVLGDPDGVLIGDDTGFEKGGTRSAGVQRQYTGTAGKITNCQIGVFLAYSSGQGRALVDRELYLPRSWTGDPLRLAAAGVPAGTGFATKPELLQQMIKRAAAAGMPFGWVAADEAYGDNGPLRDYLEEEEIAYVLAVSRDHLLAMPVGRRRADELAALAFLAATRAALADGTSGLPSSANEIRRMLTVLCAPARDQQHARRWSRWRHHHQERARQSHCQRQQLQGHEVRLEY